jgi:hypothetical protein
MEPPRRLSKELIDHAASIYQMADSAAIHRHVRSLKTVNFEQQIGVLIRESVGMDQGGVDS